MNRIGKVMVALIVAMLGTQLVAAEAPAANQNSPLGANLHVLAPWSSEYTFVDAFKQSSQWLTQSFLMWDTGELNRLPLDENGWPISFTPVDGGPAAFSWLGTLMFDSIEGHYPGGEYTVLYDGQGVLAYDFDAQLISSEPGRDVIYVDPSDSGFRLRIMETDPNGTGDYIRNIRVLSPGFSEENAPIFHPDFINNIRSYKVLRFMDWMRTNWNWDGPMRDSETIGQQTRLHPLHDAETDPRLRQRSGTRSDDQLIDWADRTRGTDARYTSENGVPLDIMIALANETQANPWFNMPHLASDDYMASFAKQVRDELHQNSYIYVEYSNEIWNSGFYQGTWIEQQGQAEWPDALDEWGNVMQPLHKRLSWYGKRSAEMCNIWKAAFGAQANRVVCVIAGQAANPWITEQMLDCPVWEEGPCHTQGIDAVAIAPYFGQHIGMPQHLEAVSGWSAAWDGGMSNLFTELEFGGVLEEIEWVRVASLEQAKQDIDDYATLAGDYDLDLVAYEGGQHLVGVSGVVNNARVTEMFSNANRDPRMKTLHEAYYHHWREAGGQVFVHYASAGVYSKWGNWGAREFADSQIKPKQDAIDSFIEKNGCDWETCSAPSLPTAVTLASQQAETQSVVILLPLLILSLTGASINLLRKKN